LAQELLLEMNRSTVASVEHLQIGNACFLQ